MKLKVVLADGVNVRIFGEVGSKLFTLFDEMGEILVINVIEEVSNGRAGLDFRFLDGSQDSLASGRAGLFLLIFVPKTSGFEVVAHAGNSSN